MILVVDMNWTEDSLGFYEFVVPILTIAQKLDKVMVRHYLKITNQDLNRCNKIILSGTALKDNFFLFELNKFHWLKEIKKPILGICAGMEIIALVFGEGLNESLEIGMTQIKTVAANPLFSGGFKAYSLHSFCIKPSTAFEILAQSTKCIQVIRHKNKPIFGVLFHPEARNPLIIENFILG
jgi:anthranilate/para-aminobenzoate synthase component II